MGAEAGAACRIRTCHFILLKLYGVNLTRYQVSNHLRTARVSLRLVQPFTSCHASSARPSVLLEDQDRIRALCRSQRLEGLEPCRRPYLSAWMVLWSCPPASPSLLGELKASGLFLLSNHLPHIKIRSGHLMAGGRPPTFARLLFEDHPTKLCQAFGRSTRTPGLVLLRRRRLPWRCASPSSPWES